MIDDIERLKRLASYEHKRSEFFSNKKDFMKDGDNHASYYSKVFADNADFYERVLKLIDHLE